MGTLEQEALGLILKIDELLEPIEESPRGLPVIRGQGQKLRRILERAEKRYYRRRGIVKPTQFSMVAAIVEKHREPDPDTKVEIKVATGRHPLTYFPFGSMM